MQQYLYFIVSEVYRLRRFDMLHVIHNKQHLEQATGLFKGKLLTIYGDLGAFLDANEYVHAQVHQFRIFQIYQYPLWTAVCMHL